MGQIIDGRAVARSVKEEIKSFVNERELKGKTIPCVASILVGEDPGSIYYQNSQEKVAKELGVKFEKICLPGDISEEEVLRTIKGLNDNKEVHGIILQLPLPKNFNDKNIIASISPEKDVDCLTDISIGRFYQGDRCFVPCTPKSVLTLLKHYDIELEGKNAVVIGRSNIVGKPAAQLLLNENCTVTICHSRTKDLEKVCREADILVAAIGRPNFVDNTYVKQGAVVIDVGTSSLNGKITGDVDFEKVKDVASYITPVPGGVGALTTTLLLLNACEAARKDDN